MRAVVRRTCGRLIWSAPARCGSGLRPAYVGRLLCRSSDWGRSLARTYVTTEPQPFSQDVPIEGSEVPEIPLPYPTQSDAVEDFARLPTYCPGCGAPSQITDSEELGYYSIQRKRVKTWIEGLDASDPAVENSIVCDRCNTLVSDPRGKAVIHPSIDSIHEIIEESTSKHNYIYHVLDAADLPMSLIPTLQQDLELPRLRTQNRRSKHTNYNKGRIAEVNFIITRSDLLAPKEDQVDTLMTYLREIIRDALGHDGRNVRLGNLFCVSAKRDWRTTKLKEHVFDKGGAGWMVGKTNVGKSRLFSKIFPKGRGGAGLASVRHVDVDREPDQDHALPPTEDARDESVTALLPPPRKEYTYPTMPVESPLSGTTASPIRIPYGNGKGELIDLPGIARSTIINYIDPKYHNQIIMQDRVVPRQHTIRPDQSLVLGGGLIRIMPNTPDLVFLASNFTELDVHITSNKKAQDAEANGPRETMDSVLTAGAHRSISLAGTMRLKYDVTRKRAGALTTKSGGKQKANDLPFVVWSADVVIEGIGWIELVAQTRRPRGYRAQAAITETAAGAQQDAFTNVGFDGGQSNAMDDIFPEALIYSPEGKHVMFRRPMGAYMLNKRKEKKAGNGARPRISMRSRKGSDRGRVAAV